MIKQMQPTLVSWLATMRLAVGLAKEAPLPLVALVLLRLTNAARPGLSIFITAGFVNALVQGEGALQWAFAFAAVEGLDLLTNTLSGPASEWLHSSTTVGMQHRVLARAAGVPLVRFQDPAFHDRMVRASKDLGSRLTSWFDSLLHLVHSIFATFGLVGAVLALGAGPAIAAVIVAGSFAGLLTNGPVARIHLELSRRTARSLRQAGAWAGLLAARPAAAEVRLFHVQDWVRKRWKTAYQSVASDTLKAARKEMLWDLVGATALIGAYAAIVVLAVQVSVAAGPAQAAGVFTGLLLTAQAMQAFLFELLGSAGRMHQHSSLIHDLLPFLDEPLGEAHGQDSPAPAGVMAPTGAVVTDVTFQYPAAKAEVLRAVSLHIRPGEVIALVGPNGAGKSTLAAILLNLYQPSSGTVEAGSATPAVSAVLQEFGRYSLPVRDNVAFSNLPKIADDRALRQALQEAGSHLGSGLDSWLGTEFGGRELSGGEWLRVAIARGTFRDAGLIVLDEPTAAIDPLAELDIIRRLIGLGRGRTAVVVSHRLGIARLADRILVMDQGRIVEAGSHTELLAAGGLYSQMWHAQAAWYTGLPQTSHSA